MSLGFGSFGFSHYRITHHDNLFVVLLKMQQHNDYAEGDHLDANLTTTCFNPTSLCRLEAALLACLREAKPSRLLPYLAKYLQSTV